MAATKTTKTVAAKAKAKPAAKPAVKKPAAKAPAATKAPAKKVAAKKPAAAAKVPAKKPVVKKEAVKKAPAKKTTAAKPVAKKPAVKAAAPKKAPAKKAAAPKAAAKSNDPIKNLALALEKALDMNKAQEIITIDLKGRSALADWMIVASGTSARQVAALANYVQHEFSKQGYKRLRVEGLPQGDWVIVDSGDVVIHLFRPEVREFYQLERLWSEDESEPNKRISLR